MEPEVNIDLAVTRIISYSCSLLMSCCYDNYQQYSEIGVSAIISIFYQ